MEVGRAIDFERAIEAAFEGKCLKEIALSIGLKYSELYKLKKKYPDFAQALDTARAEGWLLHADKLLTIFDDNPEEETERLKAISANIKWILERVRREMFGQSVEIHHEVTDVRQALAAARARILDVTPKELPAPEDPFA